MSLRKAGSAVRISVVCAVYNTSPELLLAATQSVIAVAGVTPG